MFQVPAYYVCVKKGAQHNPYCSFPLNINQKELMQNRRDVKRKWYQYNLIHDKEVFSLDDVLLLVLPTLLFVQQGIISSKNPPWKAQADVLLLTAVRSAVKYFQQIFPLESPDI